MAWKGVDSEGVAAIPSSDIKWAQWMRVARDFQLRVGLRDHRKEKFDGFMREVCPFHQMTQHFPKLLNEKDHDKLASLMKNHFGITLETKEASFKGWNWGVTDFQGLFELNFARLARHLVLPELRSRPCLHGVRSDRL